MRYHLYRVITPEEDETFVVAGSQADAAEIYMDSYTLADGETQLFKVIRWEDELAPDQRAGISGSLSSGPTGIVTWGEGGWTISPPA